MSTTGMLAVPLFPVYLWVSFGNGFRYGIPYLYLSATLSLIGFAVAITQSEYWRQSPELAAGVLLALVLLPAYVASLLRRINAERRRAEEASSHKSQFLSHMSHEIRTPLNGILGLMDLIRQEATLTRKQREYIQLTELSAQGLLHVLCDILDFSKIEAGHQELEYADFDLHALVDDVVRLFYPQARSKGLLLSSFVDAGCPYLLHGDPHHLRQILTNLVSNAVKFTHQGSISLKVRGAMTEGGDGQCLVLFEVSDTGIGIASEAQESIFEAFTQEDAGTTRRYGGTGLGTAIAKQLVELMSGRIGLRSSIGLGSTFWFELPLSLAGAESSSPQSLGPGPVLFLSDAFSSSGSLGRQLLEWGVAYDPVTTVDAALAMMRSRVSTEHPYRVLLVEQWADIPRLPLLVDFLIDSERDLTTNSVMVGVDGALFMHARYDRIHFLDRPVDKRLLFNALHSTLIAGIDQANIVPLTEHTSRQDQRRRPLSVLVCEDHQTNQVVIQQILMRDGHRVTVVSNGFELLETLELHNFDLVITDLNMPELSGIEAYKTYRMAHASETPIPFVCLTAEATEQAKQACLDAGIDAFVTKPVRPALLLRTIAAVTESRAPGTAAVSSDHSTDAIRGAGEFDRSVLDGLRSLSQDPAFLEGLISHFSTDSKALLEQMARAIEHDDINGFKFSAHALKGLAANLGLQRLFSLAREVESIPSHDYPERARERHAEMVAATARAEGFLAQAQKAPSTQPFAGSPGGRSSYQDR
jgi:two-component system sensor histidine kinase RpfC